MLQLALDIGNTRCKISDGEVCRSVSHQCSGWVEELAAVVESFRGTDSPCAWWLASVNRPVLRRVTEWLESDRPRDLLHILNFRNIPIQIDVEFPERVGVDRLLAAVTANEIRDPFRPAVVVDLGTAAKVDLVDEKGVFRGGAIAPGLRMSALAMEQQTDALPEVDIMEMLNSMTAEEISSVGRNTQEAIRAGLFWGTVGTIRELTAQTTSGLAIPPEVYLTGGGARIIRDALGEGFFYVDEMVMKGIRTTIRHTI
ncbi:MAG: type III pantothenate kinase [Planctomycetaceae bacterium]|nr:type III pantothenate kinase [Planctomycetaceae bacterium]MBQ2822126.1 type III pantothenate kinase [Thermoguttaceae bacterium]